VSDGKGCKCHAHCEHECCCDADWTSKEVYDLRADLAQRTAERDEARREACQLEVNWNFVCSQLNEKKFRKLTLDPKAVAVERGWDCFKEVKR
jgi:hypothetical protein